MSTTLLLTQAPAQTLIDFPYAPSPNFIILWIQDQIPNPVNLASCDQPGPAHHRYSCACSTHYTWAVNLLGWSCGKQPIKMCKSCKEFTSCNLEQLLGAVINVNLFMAPCSKIGDSWKEVTMIVQVKGSFQNQEPEASKNKFSSLLAWVEVSDHCLSHSPHTDNYIFRGGRRKRLGHLLAGSSTVIWPASPCSQGN